MKLGLHEMIRLSKIDITIQMCYLFSLLSSWLVDSNTFIFPWMVMTPTLLDIVSILGMPITMIEAHVAHDTPIPSFRIALPESVPDYVKFLLY